MGEEGQIDIDRFVNDTLAVFFKLRKKHSVLRKISFYINIYAHNKYKYIDICIYVKSL